MMPSMHELSFKNLNINMLFSPQRSEHCAIIWKGLVGMAILIRDRKRKSYPQAHQQSVNMPVETLNGYVSNVGLSYTTRSAQVHYCTIFICPTTSLGMLSTGMILEKN